MTSLAWLIPAALILGGMGLAAFLWSLKTGQYEDLDGAAWRALEDRAPGGPDSPDDNTVHSVEPKGARTAALRSNRDDAERL